MKMLRLSLGLVEKDVRYIYIYIYILDKICTENVLPGKRKLGKLQKRAKIIVEDAE